MSVEPVIAPSLRRHLKPWRLVVLLLAMPAMLALQISVIRAHLSYLESLPFSLLAGGGALFALYTIARDIVRDATTASAATAAPIVNAAGTRISLPAEVNHDLSVVIVSYNTREMTLRCIESVLANSTGVAVQVIVVDNCSSDGSASALRERFPDITVIDSPVNGGFAAGNNQGFERARGRYVLLLNPDTELRRDALRLALDHMDAHPEVGVLGPRIWNSEGTLDRPIFRFLTLRQVLLWGLVPRAVMRRTRLFSDPRYAAWSLAEQHDVEVVTGCFMLARREVLERVGGLDERFFMYGEEAEWCHRIAQAGWVVRYCPQVEILHHGGASTASLPVWRTVEVAKGHLLFLRITRGVLAARIAAIMIALRDAGRLAALAPAILRRGVKNHPVAPAVLARLGFALGSLVKPPTGQSLGRGPHSPA